mgnify:CR=1 FL=1
MQKTLRNIFLLSIVLFICSVREVDAAPISVEYVDSNGNSWVTCYSEDVGINSYCQFDNEVGIEFHGASENDYRNFNTAPNTVCYVTHDAFEKHLFSRSCSEVDGYDASNDVKMTLTKRMPSETLSCRYEIPGTTPSVNFNYNSTGTTLNTYFLVSQYDDRKISLRFDGSNCFGDSTLSGCRDKLYCLCENCDSTYGEIKLNISFEQKEGYTDCANFTHTIGCTGSDCVEIKDDDIQEKSAGCNIFGDRITDMLKQVIDLIQLAVPIIIVILTIIDFIGIVLSGEEKNFKAAWSKLIKRLMIGAAIIFLPMLLAFIIDMSGALAPYGIERNQLFCSLF